MFCPRILSLQSRLFHSLEVAPLLRLKFGKEKWRI